MVLQPDWAAIYVPRGQGSATLYDMRCIVLTCNNIAVVGCECMSFFIQVLLERIHNLYGYSCPVS